MPDLPHWCISLSAIPMPKMFKGSRVVWTKNPSDYLVPFFHFCCVCHIQTALRWVVVSIRMLKREICQGICVEVLSLASTRKGFTYFYCTSGGDTGKLTVESTCRSHMRLEIHSFEIYIGTKDYIRVKTSDSVLVQPSWVMLSEIIPLLLYCNSNLCVHLLCL